MAYKFHVKNIYFYFMEESHDPWRSGLTSHHPPRRSRPILPMWTCDDADLMISIKPGLTRGTTFF